MRDVPGFYTVARSLRLHNRLGCVLSCLPAQLRKDCQDIGRERRRSLLQQHRSSMSPGELQVQCRHSWPGGAVRTKACMPEQPACTAKVSALQLLPYAGQSECPLKHLHTAPAPADVLVAFELQAKLHQCSMAAIRAELVQADSTGELQH